MAYPNMGNLYASEGGFKTPGAYEAFLTSEGKQRAAYLSEMDQFFTQLTESKRQFDLSLGFQEKELASRETLTREQFDLQRELQDEQLEFQRWEREQYYGLENKKFNQQGMNYLGGPSARDIFEASRENKKREYDLAERFLGRGSSEPRFYTVDYSGSNAALRPSRPGEVSSQLPEYSNNTSGVSDIDWYEENY